MFTGLIEKVGRLTALEKRSGGGLLSVSHTPWDQPLNRGDSVSVQGACLTVVRCDKTSFVVDVLEETLLKTTLGGLPPGSPLNLERALTLGSRLGGHILSGHIDGRGDIRSIGRSGDDWVLDVACAEDLLRDIVSKGSVALEGMSLTVVQVMDSRFSVHIIPFTWQQTSVSSLREGNRVNIETDILAKYVRRHLERHLTPARKAPLSLDELHAAGF